MSLATIVKGNTFSLAIPLQVYAVEDGEVVLRDYTPESGDAITIRLKGDRRNYTYIPSTNGSTAFIHLEGSEVVGVYAVEVEIVKDDDSKLTSMRFEQLSIVESIDELNEGQITEGIEQGAIYLDPEIFIAGEDGRGIVSIVKTATSGLVDTYTITYTDNTTSTFNVTNGKDGINGQDGVDGADGVGIASIAKTGTQGLVDTYTITMTNGTTYTYQVTNGKDGEDGEDGQDGTDGVGIVSITKTSTSGLVDTYTILLTNGTTTTFTVTNGSDATQVQSDWSQTDPTQVDYIKNKPTIDNAPTQNSTNLVSSGGVYSAIAPKLAYYELTADTNLAPIWQAYMGGGTISDQQAFNAACEYLLSKMYEIKSNTIFLLNGDSCLKAFYEGYPTTSPLYNPTDSCCVYFEYATEYQGSITYNVVGVGRNTTDGVTWGWYSNNGEIELLPAKTFNDYCPIIEDTRSSAVAAITGVAPFSTLVDGQRIMLFLANYYNASNPTLTLTLSGGEQTSAIPIYAQTAGSNTRPQAATMAAGAYFEMVYVASNNRWQVVGKDTNTTYPAIGQSNINQGTNNNNGVITSKLFHDNAYIVDVPYTSSVTALKANKFYDFGTVSSALTIPDLSTTDLVNNALNFYALRFIAGADALSITFPTGVIVDDEPTINTGDYVEIMINLYVVNGVNNFYASIKVWQAQS